MSGEKREKAVAGDDAASPSVLAGVQGGAKLLMRLRSPSALLFLLCMGLAFYAGRFVPGTWTAEKVLLDVKRDGSRLYYTYKGKRKYLGKVGLYKDSPLHPSKLKERNALGCLPSSQSPRCKAPKKQDFVVERSKHKGSEQLRYYQLLLKRHWGFWSLLPALVAILLCWLTREPLTALFGGIVAGALLLGRYDLTEKVLVPAMSTKSAAGVLILYLWLLGGLMGIWSRTGAALAFAEFMAKHLVRGPRSAKLVAWFLGVIFFQGGTVSSVLVGTTVKPLADKEKIAHEELAYIVDSTSSPIASQLAFNAWPGYVQAFIFVAGVSWLATEADRIAFFFKSVPFCFYAIFAVLGTFLLAIEKTPFLGKQMQEAIDRARTTGALDAPDAQPLSASELQVSRVPEGYTPHVIEFFLPLGLLIAIAIGTFLTMGSPQVRWAFGVAVLSAMALALGRGMSLKDLMDGYVDGLKGVVLGAVILMFAITIGSISKEAGGGVFLVEQLGTTLPYWSLPVLLQLLTIVIAFSTGTSWGTYAVAFPLAMPLSWAIAQSQGLNNPELFMTLCFAAVMDGSVYGDQCSPISDTTVLSAMCTGCDLMDHVKTQIPQATAAAVLAAICWTGITLLFV